MSMMSQKKMLKKKKREKDVKRRIDYKRQQLRAPIIEENQNRKKMARIAKLQKDMGDLSMWADDVLMKLDDEKLSQIEKNAKILKALEIEYEKEKEKRDAINKSLEEKGLKSLDDKLGHLHNQLVEQQKNMHSEAEQRNISIGKPQPPKEVSDVEIIRASDVQ